MSVLYNNKLIRDLQIRHTIQIRLEGECIWPNIRMKR